MAVRLVERTEVTDGRAMVVAVAAESARLEAKRAVLENISAVYVREEKS
jgi:hypothetical protein